MPLQSLAQKGAVQRGVEGVDLPAPHFKRPQGKSRKRRCKRCNMSGHNITTCGREAPPPKTSRGRPVGSGTRKRTQNTALLDQIKYWITYKAKKR